MSNEVTAQSYAQERQLEDLAAEINAELELAERSWDDIVAHIVAAGKALIEVKARLKHGQWGPWLAANFPQSERHAQRYMQLARKSDTVADLPSMRQALAAIGEPRTNELPAASDSDEGTPGWTEAELTEHGALEAELSAKPHLVTDLEWLKRAVAALRVAAAMADESGDEYAYPPRWALTVLVAARPLIQAKFEAARAQ